MKILKDIPYSSVYSNIRKMDVYIPQASANRAAILFIHGGGWVKGDKTLFHDVASWFCEQGYTCATMQYHLSHQKTYPAALEDARLAMQYLRQHADHYGFDPNRIAAIGSSAGGYLAAMLACTPPEDQLGRTAQLTCMDTRPNAVALYCPVTVLHGGRETMTSFMGQSEESAPEQYRQASPLYRIRGNEPPFLIIQGDHDRITPLENTQTFIQKLNSLGTAADLIILHGVDHGFGYGVNTLSQRYSIRCIQEFLHDRICSTDCSSNKM